MSVETKEIPVGVVGLGLMGCSICTCLLMAGHPVVAIAPISADMQTAEPRIRHHLQKSKEQGLIKEYCKNLPVILKGFLGCTGPSPLTPHVFLK